MKTLRNFKLRLTAFLKKIYLNIKAKQKTHLILNKGKQALESWKSWRRHAQDKRVIYQWMMNLKITQNLINNMLLAGLLLESLQIPVIGCHQFRVRANAYQLKDVKIR